MLCSWRSKFRTVFFLCLMLCSGIHGFCRTPPIALQNENFILYFEQTSIGVPFIKSAIWKADGQLIFTASPPANNKVLAQFFGADLQHKKFENTSKVSETPLSKILSFSIHTPDLILTWNYELVKQNFIINTWVNIKNKFSQKTIKQFPIFIANMNFGKNNELEYFDALEFTSHRYKNSNQHLLLHSKVYSSDNRISNGNLPYWIINANHKTYFSIAWCGGWQANIIKKNNGINFEVSLPPEESQLVLNDNEQMDGPKLSITFIKGDDVYAKSRYDFANKNYSNQRYKMPLLDYFPLVYNHWYSVRFNVNEFFLRNQYQLIPEYGFDVFVVDAGWYENITSWKPSLTKFKTGGFESILKAIRDKGILTGIWTCPWLVDSLYAVQHQLVFSHTYFNKFMRGYALGINADYRDKLSNHIANLRADYAINWWKFDQEFIATNIPQGKMRTIHYFQSALQKVREDNPDLYIENCLSGGRMINNFTDQISQAHWIKDGKLNGLIHAKSNIREVIGAAKILPLQKLHRWTNRINEIDNLELLRYYCRSAMIGVWGISTDLSKISSKQNEVTKNEIALYREMNTVKLNNCYEMIFAKDSTAIISFYGVDFKQNYLLIFNWLASSNSEKQLLTPMPALKGVFKFTNIDTGIEQIFTLTESGQYPLNLSMGIGRLSAVYKVEKMVEIKKQNTQL